MIPWVHNAVKLIAEGKLDSALDVEYSSIHSESRYGLYSEIDAAILDIISTKSPDLMLGALIMTREHRHLLKNRETLLSHYGNLGETEKLHIKHL